MITKTTVRVVLDVECDEGTWLDDVSLARTHAEAVQRMQNILGRIFKGEARNGDIESVKVRGIDSFDVHVIVRER